jgi:hypothetical protein
MQGSEYVTREQKKFSLQEGVEYRAYFDTLTGQDSLANRRWIVADRLT